MKVESRCIAEWSPSTKSILQYFWSALSDNWSWTFWGCPFYTGFTVCGFYIFRSVILSAARPITASSAIVYSLFQALTSWIWINALKKWWVPLKGSLHTRRWFDVSPIRWILCLVLVNPGRPIPTWLKNCWLGRKESIQTKSILWNFLLHIYWQCCSNAFCLYTLCETAIKESSIKHTNSRQIGTGERVVNVVKWASTTKPVFGVSDKVIFKSVSSAIETTMQLENWNFICSK